MVKVKIKNPGYASYSKTKDMVEIIRLLRYFLRDKGLTLTIHISDGTKIDVYPKCLRCGCYNTIKPLVKGLCEHCVGLRE